MDSQIRVPNKVNVLHLAQLIALDWTNADYARVIHTRFMMQNLSYVFRKLVKKNILYPLTN